jgi:hypothetical protein
MRTFSAAAILLFLLACGSSENAASVPPSTGSGSGGAADTGQECGPQGSTPSPRADTAGALSADGSTLVVFGGDTANVVCGSAPEHAFAGDTWLLDVRCGAWRSIEGGAPSSRSRHAMALDSQGNRALMFGGRSRTGASGPYTLWSDTWAFDFGTNAWSVIEATGEAPSPRSNSAVAVMGRRLFVVGGNTSTSGLTFAPTSDVYALDLDTATWSKFVTSGPVPPARLFHAIAADEAGGRIVVLEGGDENAFTGPFLRDVWSLDLASGTWTNLALPPSEEGRIKFGAVVSPEAKLVAFGGHDDGILGNRNDVVVLDLASPSAGWTTASTGDAYNAPSQGACSFPPDFTTEDLASPERRSAFAFAPAVDGRSFVVFGGDSDCGRLSDAWRFDVSNRTWSVVRPSLPGLTCPRTGSTTCSGLCG